MERESKKLEYKEIVSKSFLKTVSAFSNYGGGKIIFGISDKYQITGFDDPIQECLNIENSINDNISPQPKYRLQINENSTITLSVDDGMFKPYLYKNKAYKRNDSSTIEVDRLELNRLILTGLNQSYEQQPYLKKHNLTFNTLEQSLIKHLGIEKLSKDILLTLELISSSGEYNNAAALLADNNTFMGIDLVRFGENIDIFLDRETHEKTSILTQYENAISMFKKYYQYEKIEGFSRKTIELVPEEAFREAIANALIHRTWDVPAHIRVSMFKDRIEITSPGGLPNDMTEEYYLNGQISSLRNPIIANIFFRLKYIEKFGTGIRRINHAYKDNNIKPTYYVSDTLITITLPLLNSVLDITVDEKAIINLLENGQIMTTAQIINETGFSKNKVVRLLNSLISKNIVVKQGNNRSTRYFLK